MENAYAQALWRSVEGGRTPKDAVASLAALLKKEGRSDLLPRIQKAFVRLVASKESGNAKVYVAHERDGKDAFKQSGVAEADIIVDETLIGGWRLEDRGTLVDMSFKKQLLDIFSGATQSV